MSHGMYYKKKKKKHEVCRILQQDNFLNVLYKLETINKFHCVCFNTHIVVCFTTYYIFIMPWEFYEMGANFINVLKGNGVFNIFATSGWKLYLGNYITSWSSSSWIYLYFPVFFLVLNLGCVNLGAQLLLNKTKTSLILQ